MIKSEEKLNEEAEEEGEEDEENKEEKINEGNINFGPSLSDGKPFNSTNESYGQLVIDSLYNLISLYELIGDNYKSQIYNDKLEELIGNHDYTTPTASIIKGSSKGGSFKDSKSDINVDRVD